MVQKIYYLRHKITDPNNEQQNNSKIKIYHIRSVQHNLYALQFFLHYLYRLFYHRQAQ
jgi:hypothetical protein